MRLSLYHHQRIGYSRDNRPTIQHAMTMGVRRIYNELRIRPILISSTCIRQYNNIQRVKLLQLFDKVARSIYIETQDQRNMPSSSRSTVVNETPIHPDASCFGGRRRSGSSSSKHHEPSRSGSTRRSDSSSSKHHEPSRSSSTRDGRSDEKFDGHRGTITRLHTSRMLPAISETPEKITSVPRFTDEGVDRTKTRSSRHHADDRTETRSSRHHADDRTKTRSSRNHADEPNKTR